VKTLLSAAYVAPIDGSLQRDWAVVFEAGGIIAVGPTPALRRAHPDAAERELGDAIILPGLINAHTHLELTSLGQLPKPGSFVDWILELRERLGPVTDIETFVQGSVRAGVAQCLRFGVTAVGDVTLNPAISRPILAAAAMRGVSFGEVLGMAGRAGQTEMRIAAAIDRTSDTSDFRSGIEPHAPYSLDLTGYRRCLEVARDLKLPLATHLAETPNEAEFLADHGGEFRRLWEILGAWSNDVSRAAGGPIRVMQRIGLLDYPTLLAHVNYPDDDELDVLARGRASVVYCPRTHEYFGHRPHRFAEMLARGINVAIGTDSTASSPDLNVVEDVRLVHAKHLELDVELLWSMITTRAARALGMEQRCGRLLPGMLADLCVFAVTSDDPLREILERDALPREVWIGGKQVYAAAP
jgi:cytosine/adenosine deaminase-related metal-dependent hydrolase